MTGTFDIRHQWVSSLHEPPEVSRTSALLRIALGTGVSTRNQDDWSQTIQDEVRVSAYPIAIWLAASWWRLLWEPFPMVSVPTLSWRMAHELASAGYGYVWPRLLFVSDGRDMHIWAAQSDPDSKDPVRYLSNLYQAIDIGTFESKIESFVDATLARLTATNLESTTLHGLWAEIRDERSDSSLGMRRRLEAMLGFDPDDCPDGMIELFEKLIPEAGMSAVEEIAPVCSSSQPEDVLRAIVQISESQGRVGRMDASLKRGDYAIDSTKPAWENGRRLAGELRSLLGLDGAPLRDAQLCDLTGLSPDSLRQSDSVPRIPLGLATRAAGSSDIKYFLQKRNVPGRRFELARFICDYLIADESDRWLPVTDAKTARQRIQRAFAAEFLCPIEAIRSLIGVDYSEDAIDEAAAHFQVSSRAIEAQLVNNGSLPPSTLDDGFDFWRRPSSYMNAFISHSY